MIRLLRLNSQCPGSHSLTGQLAVSGSAEFTVAPVLDSVGGIHRFNSCLGLTDSHLAFEPGSLRPLLLLFPLTRWAVAVSNWPLEVLIRGCPFFLLVRS